MNYVLKIFDWLVDSTFTEPLKNWYREFMLVLKYQIPSIG